MKRWVSQVVSRCAFQQGSLEEEEREEERTSSAHLLLMLQLRVEALVKLPQLGAVGVVEDSPPCVVHLWCKRGERRARCLHSCHA